jgi:hypothetical protein
MDNHATEACGKRKHTENIKNTSDTTPPGMMNDPAPPVVSQDILSLTGSTSNKLKLNTI